MQQRDTEPKKSSPDLSFVVGIDAITDYFGHWPSFHDAEVVSIRLNRSGTSQLAIHTFNTTGGINERGYFATESHGVVSFWIEEITALHLDHFNHQNVIFGLELFRADDGIISVNLDGCYGLEGSISARTIRVSVEPGIPSDSIYAEQ